jgi:hypothetical protein
MGYDSYSDPNSRVERKERQSLISQSRDTGFSQMSPGSWKNTNTNSARSSKKDVEDSGGMLASANGKADTSMQTDWQAFASDGLGSFSDAVASPPKYLVQDLLVLVACFGLIAVMVFGARATDSGLEKAAGRPIIRNMFTAAFCFFVADIIAQVSAPSS